MNISGARRRLAKDSHRMCRPRSLASSWRRLGFLYSSLRCQGFLNGAQGPQNRRSCKRIRLNLDNKYIIQVINEIMVLVHKAWFFFTIVFVMYADCILLLIYEDHKTNNNKFTKLYLNFIYIIIINLCKRLH